MQSTNWIIKGVIRDGTVWYDTATDIWDSLGTDGGGKGVIRYLTLQEQKQFGRSWHQMRGWVQFEDNVNAQDVKRYFKSGDWMFEIARSTPQNNDQFLEMNQFAAGDRWDFGSWTTHPSQGVMVGNRRYYIAVKEDTDEKDSRIKKASLRSKAYKSKQAWKKGYAKKKFFEGPPMSDDEDSDPEWEQSQVFHSKKPLDREEKGGLELTFDVSEPEEDSQDDEPLIRGAEGFDGIEALMAEMSDDDEEEIDYDDEEQAREDRWAMYQAKQEIPSEREVRGRWLGWAGVPDWNEGDNDLEVDIMG